MERQRQQEALVTKLEAQLEQQISGARAPQQSTDTARTGSSSAFHLSHALGSPLAASYEAEAAAHGTSDARGDLQGRTGGAAVGTLGNWESNSLSLVDILRGQRDRFRGKVLELEKQCQQLRTELAAEKKRGAQVTQDNVKLFQKVKYLQSYSRAGSGSGQGDGGGGSGGGSSGDQLDIVETGGTGGSARRRQDGLADFEAPYSRMYEETVNPFTVFNRYCIEELLSRGTSAALWLVCSWLWLCCSPTMQEGKAAAVQELDNGGEDHTVQLTVLLVEQVRAELHLLLLPGAAPVSVLDAVPLYPRQPQGVQVKRLICYQLLSLSTHQSSSSANCRCAQAAGP